jgi:hypothetical protein
MDRGVKKGRDDKCRRCCPSLTETALHKTAPEDFLSETDGKKEQQPDNDRGKASEVCINRGDVPGAVRKKGREKPGHDHEKPVSRIENTVEKCGQENSEEEILHGEFPA